MVETVEGSPAAEHLRKGDVIVAIDGTRVQTTCDVGRLIDMHSPGEEIEVAVRRGSDDRTFTITTMSNPDNEEQALIGILMDDIGYHFKSDVKVSFDTDNIGGPSAGLMFSLALYDLLTPDDLTDGREIAGTGVIDCDGGVGPIGGIDLKVVAAQREGAEIFLAPIANFDEAVAAAKEGIEVVPISNFADALEYLEDNP